MEDISDDEVNRLNNKGKNRRNSSDSALEPHEMIRVRTRSSGNLAKKEHNSFIEKPNFNM